MLGTHSLALFATTVFVINATPGVDMMLTLTRTLRYGVRGGLAAALGVMAGCVVHALAAALGLAALIAASAAAFSVIKWVGAAYLLWLAFGMLKSAWAGETATAMPQLAESPGLPALFRQGVLTNVLNPKIALFFLALLPQFIDADAPHKTLAFLFLGAWFIVQGGLFLFAFVLLVAPLRRWQAGSLWKRGLNAAGGGLFAWLAVRLALVERA
ncbi:MAG: LysE family translocator [Burkholderiales bacterium]|nr:LysE family translocator [Burkholderiales bacterium]